MARERRGSNPLLFRRYNAQDNWERKECCLPLAQAECHVPLSSLSPAASELFVLPNPLPFCPALPAGTRPCCVFLSYMRQLFHQSAAVCTSLPSHLKFPSPPLPHWPTGSPAFLPCTPLALDPGQDHAPKPPPGSTSEAWIGAT